MAADRQIPLQAPNRALEPRPFACRHGCVLWWDFIGPFYRYSTWTEGLWRRVQVGRARSDPHFARFKKRILAASSSDIPE